MVSLASWVSRATSRRRLFMAGLAAFTAASLACALATSDTFLIIMRGLQGLGAAVLRPAALSIVMNMFGEGAERNKALSAWGGIGATGATGAVAPTVTATHSRLLMSQGHAAAAALTGGFQWALWVSGLTALAAVPVTFLLIRRAEIARAVTASLHPQARYLLPPADLRALAGLHTGTPVTELGVTIAVAATALRI